MRRFLLGVLAATLIFHMVVDVMCAVAMASDGRTDVAIAIVPLVAILGFSAGAVIAAARR